MSVSLTESQYEALRKIAEDNDLTSYNVKEYSFSKKGDNYLGHLRAVTIEDKTKKLQIILKVSPQNEEFRKSIGLRSIFLKEIKMYERILANFKKFQEDLGVNKVFNCYPKYYGKCERELSECLVLENLVRKGYTHWNRKIPMNTEHISLVMSELGRYHSVSYAMKKRNPELFDDLTNFLKNVPTDDDMKGLDTFIKSSTTTIKKAIQGHTVLEDAFNKFLPEITHFFFEELKEDEDKMIVIHGDVWCNNIMFKYEDPSDTRRPTNVSFIDWQISQYNLPVMDLAYFFCTSSSKQALSDYKKYLKIYHDSLSQHLIEMSCDPEELLSFTNLEYLWRKAAKFGLLIGGFIFKLLLIDSENAANTQQNTTSIENFYDQFVITGIEEELNQKIVDLCTFMVENKFL